MRRRHAAEPPRTPGDERPPRPKRSRPLLDLAWWQWPLVGVGMLLVSFGVGYLLSTLVLFPRPETAGTGIPVPSLYGDTWTEAEEAIREAGLVPGEVTELASSTVERGRVVAQTPIPDQQLRSGGVVSLGVSGGAPERRVPPVRGMREETARELLEGVGFEVEVRQVRVDDLAGGVVTRTDPEPGAARPVPSLVTLLVNSAPVVDSVQGELPVGVPSGAPEGTPERVPEPADTAGPRPGGAS